MLGEKKTKTKNKTKQNKTKAAREKWDSPGLLGGLEAAERLLGLTIVLR